MSTYLEIFSELRKGTETKEELKSILRKTHESIQNASLKEVDDFWDAACDAALTAGMSPKEFLEEFKWVERPIYLNFWKEIPIRKDMKSCIRNSTKYGIQAGYIWSI